MDHNNASIHKSQQLPGALQSAHTSLLWTFLDIAETKSTASRDFSPILKIFGLLSPQERRLRFQCRPECPEAGDELPSTPGPHPSLSPSFFSPVSSVLPLQGLYDSLKWIRFFRRPLTLSDYLILGVPTNLFPRSSEPRLCLGQKGVGIRKVWIQYTVYLHPLPYTLQYGGLHSLPLSDVCVSRFLSRPTVVTGGGRQSRGTMQSCPPVEMNFT